MSVWEHVVGQDRAVGRLQRAAAAAAEIVEGTGPGVAMTHAWVITGPPGSGRTTAAGAFAAALLCPDGGCGTCHSCTTVRDGTHADVEVVRPVGMHHRVDHMRELVRRAALSPAGGRWQVVVIEDADRMEGTSQDWRAANALLKAIEEPTPRTVWILCAPSLEDVIPTIRSRCRHIGLVTPPAAAVADVLVRRDGIDPAMAAFAARAAQSHIGRAEVLRIPTHLTGVGPCLTAAANVVEAAQEEAATVTAPLDDAETQELARALGQGSSRGLDGRSRAQLKELEKDHKRRATRIQRDVLDLSLLDLMGFYRDVLAVQLGAEMPLLNTDVERDVRAVARSCTPERTLQRIDAVIACREQVAGNVAPLLALEALTLALR